MFEISSWQAALGSVAGTALVQTVSFLPNLVGSIIVLILGIVLGNWAKSAVVKSLQLMRFESMVKDSKFKQFLKKAEITQKVEDILGAVIKWVIVLIFFIAAVNILGLTTVSALLGSVLAYIPSVLAAVIVLAIGILLAGVVERVVKGALASVDLKTSRLMGKIASYTVVTIAALAALSELRIAENFINILFIGFVAMLTLGFGLAIGLGAKDLVSKMLEDWHTTLKKELKK
jgi:hypothetical protein